MKGQFQAFSPSKLLRWMQKLGQAQRRLLVLMAGIAGAGWLLVELIDEVFDGSTQAIDEFLVLVLRNPNDLSDPIGPRWVEEMGRDFTALGGISVLTFLALASVGYLLLEQKRRTALLVAVSVGGGTLLSLLLKGLFERARPTLVPHHSHVYTTSFPSGHSMMAAATYLTLAVLLAHTQERRRVKAYLLLLAIFLTTAIGLSRVYMGVHWPTDVLAGWTMGAMWALGCYSLAEWLRQRGEIEAPGTQEDPVSEEEQQAAHLEVAESTQSTS